MSVFFELGLAFIVIVAATLIVFCIINIFRRRQIGASIAIAVIIGLMLLLFRNNIVDLFERIW